MAIEEKFVEFEENGKKIRFVLVSTDFSIDPTILDVELCKMGRIMMGYGFVESQLRTEVERKKAALEHMEADLDTTIRLNAKEEGRKITEAAITAAIKGDMGREELLTSIRTSEQHFNTMRWAMRALQGRKDCMIALTYREKALIQADQFSS